VRDAVLRPKLLLLDEPSFDLAPLVVQEIYQLLSVSRMAAFTRASRSRL
jgi:ABC-type branched-subunit amino acid transport system ATPase component